MSLPFAVTVLVELPPAELEAMERRLTETVIQHFANDGGDDVQAWSVSSETLPRADAVEFEDLLNE